MLALYLFAALLGQVVPDTPTTVSPVTVESKRSSPTLTDTQIIRQLDDLHRTQPDRMVCVKVRRITSLLPRTECATLAEWYGREIVRDTRAAIAPALKDRSGVGPARLGPPDELVVQIKQAMKTRAMANARARKTP